MSHYELRNIFLLVIVGMYELVAIMGYLRKYQNLSKFDCYISPAIFVYSESCCQELE